MRWNDSQTYDYRFNISNITTIYRRYIYIHFFQSHQPTSHASELDAPLTACMLLRDLEATPTYMMTAGRVVDMLGTNNKNLFLHRPSFKKIDNQKTHYEYMRFSPIQLSIFSRYIQFLTIHNMLQVKPYPNARRTGLSRKYSARNMCARVWTEMEYPREPHLSTNGKVTTAHQVSQMQKIRNDMPNNLIDIMFRLL